MAFPAPSDFRSGEPLAAWFSVGAGEGRTLNVATQGMTANKRIQRALNEYGAGRTSVFGAPLREDGIIGDATLARLFTAAREHASADPEGGYGTIAERLAADRRNRTISPLSYRWALWLAYVRNNSDLRERGWEHVVLPANTTLPTYNGAPDDDRNAGGANLQAVSWLQDVQPAPVAPARSSTSTPVGSTAPTPGTRQPQTTGPQTVTTGTEPGSSSLAPVTQQPSGLVASSATRTSSAMETEYMGVKGKWLLAGAVVLGLGYLAIQPSRRSPRRGSRSQSAMRSQRRASSRYSQKRRAR